MFYRKRFQEALMFFCGLKKITMFEINNKFKVNYRNSEIPDRLIKPKYFFSLYEKLIIARSYPSAPSEG